LPTGAEPDQGTTQIENKHSIAHIQTKGSSRRRQRPRQNHQAHCLWDSHRKTLNLPVRQRDGPFPANLMLDQGGDAPAASQDIPESNIRELGQSAMTARLPFTRPSFISLAS